MATPAVVKNSTKRRKPPVFNLPEETVISGLVEQGKLKRIDIPAKAEHTTESGKLRKAQPARVIYHGDRSATLARYGGNEKALLFAANEYYDTYVKRMNSKGKTADPVRAVNRTSESFAKMDTSNLPANVQEAIAALAEYAAKNPMAPTPRKIKAPKA